MWDFAVPSETEDPPQRQGKTEEGIGMAHLRSKRFFFCDRKYGEKVCLKGGEKAT